MLRNGGGVLALYRVRHDGMLKRLRCWPAELEEGAMITDPIIKLMQDAGIPITREEYIHTSGSRACGHDDG